MSNTYLDSVISWIKGAIAHIKNLVKRFIEGCLQFFKDVVTWFKSLKLVQGVDIPFIANANSKEFQQMLNQAPVKNVGIFQGVYNEETGEITHHEYIEADSVDEQTYETLKGEPIVVLS